MIPLVRGDNLVLNALVVQCDGLLCSLALVEVEVLDDELVFVVVPHLQLLLFGDQAAPTRSRSKLLL